jgi:hypothetical protein
MGIVIESPRLAAVAADLFDHAVPEIAYRIVADEGGGIQWQDAAGLTFSREPGMGLASRAVMGILKRLDIEWLL